MDAGLIWFLISKFIGVYAAHPVKCIVLSYFNWKIAIDRPFKI